MISVCIATYNGEKFIRQQLESIIRQLSDEDEIVVSDNGSDDDTLSIISSLKEKRIRIIEGPEKKSSTCNFENAIKAAKGDYIFLSDQDDVWREDKVTVCLKWLKNYHCVISDATMTDENLNIIENSYFAKHKTRPGRIYNILIRNGYMGCCMAFRRDVLETSLPFPEDIPMHDIWIGNVAAYIYNVKFINDKLIYFRCHGNNSSFTATGKSSYAIYKKVLFRFNTIKNIIIKIIRVKSYMNKKNNIAKK